VKFLLLSIGKKIILIRYLIVGMSGFIFVSLSTIFLNENLNGRTKHAYAISLFILYLADYVLNLKFVFRSTHQTTKIVNYTLYLVFSWITGVCVFSVFYYFLTNSTYANAGTLLFLFPLRYFLSQRVLSGRS